MIVEMFKIMIFLLFPSLYFLISVFNLKSKVDKLLYFCTILVIIICYNPMETSDFWRIKFLYEKIKEYTFIETLKLKIDFIIPITMYFFNKLGLPFKFFLVYSYIYYGVIINIFKNKLNSKKYMIVFLGFAIFSSTMMILENPRSPLATVSFIYAILLPNKFTKQKNLLLLISIFLHLSYLPLVLLALISKIKFKSLPKILYILSFTFIIFDINLGDIIIKLISIMRIENYYINLKIQTYLLDLNRVEGVGKINWFYYLHNFYFIFFGIYILFERKKGDYLQNSMFLLLSFVNLFFHLKTIFYRYMVSMFLLEIIYIAKRYSENELRLKKIIIYLHILLLLYSMIMWVRILASGYQSMDWLNNLVFIIFKIS